MWSLAGVFGRIVRSAFWQLLFLMNRPGCSVNVLLRMDRDVDSWAVPMSPDVPGSRCLLKGLPSDGGPRNSLLP